MRFTIPTMSLHSAKKATFLQVLKINREWLRVIEKKVFDVYDFNKLKNISLIDKQGAKYFAFYWGFIAKGMRKNPTSEDLIEANLCDKAVLDLQVIVICLQEIIEFKAKDAKTFEIMNEKIACFRNYLNHLEDFANKRVDFLTIKNEYSLQEQEEMKKQTEKIKLGKEISPLS